jgi:hypothetical protein
VIDTQFRRAEKPTSLLGLSPKRGGFLHLETLPDNFARRFRALLGAGLHGVSVSVIGKNHDTF